MGTAGRCVAVGPDFMGANAECDLRSGCSVLQRDLCD